MLQVYVCMCVYFRYMCVCVYASGICVYVCILQVHVCMCVCFRYMCVCVNASGTCVYVWMLQVQKCMYVLHTYMCVYCMYRRVRMYFMYRYVSTSCTDVHALHVQMCAFFSCTYTVYTTHKHRFSTYCHQEGQSSRGAAPTHHNQ